MNNKAKVMAQTFANWILFVIECINSEDNFIDSYILLTENKIHNNNIVKCAYDAARMPDNLLLDFSVFLSNGEVISYDRDEGFIYSWREIKLSCSELLNFGYCRIKSIIMHCDYCGNVSYYHIDKNTI